MKNILLPTDFSENSMNAIKYALKLLEGMECKFYLLNTFTPLAYHSGKAFNNFTSIEIVRANKKAASERIKSMRDSLKDLYHNPKHEFQWSVSYNLLIDKMKTMIREKNIDFIIMGTKGATGARELFMGTQTMYTIKNVEQPVMAVPAGLHNTKPNEILFATDYKIIRESDLLLLKFYRDLHNARLHILNVYTHDTLDAEQIKNRNRISEYFKPKKPVFHIMEGDDIAGVVESFQKENNIDLVLMLHKEHSFFENILFKPVINKLVYHTNIPFVVVPAKNKD